MCHDCKPWRNDKLGKLALARVDGPIDRAEYNAMIALLHAQAEQERQATTVGIKRAAREKKL